MKITFYGVPDKRFGIWDLPKSKGGTRGLQDMDMQGYGTALNGGGCVTQDILTSTHRMITMRLTIERVLTSNKGMREDRKKRLHANGKRGEDGRMTAFRA